MNKLLVIALVSLSVAYACHYSCGGNCDLDGMTCTGCIEHASLLSHHRGCACDDGYYIKKVGDDEWECKQLITSNIPGVIDLDACERNIAEQAEFFDYTVTCGSDIDSNNVNLAVSRFFLDFPKSGITSTCAAKVRLTPIYFEQITDDINEDANIRYFTGLYAQYVTVSPDQSTVTFTFPLIDLYDLAPPEVDQNGNEDESSPILQQLLIGVLVGHTRKDVAQHTWILQVYTNREEVNVIYLDVDRIRTQGDTCIILEDLDTEAYICSDSTCSSPQSSDYLYVVNEVIFIKVYFLDPSYTKWLKFIDLFYKAGNSIFRFTQDTTPTYFPGYTILTLKLLEPELGAVIQINSLIATQNPSRFRALTEEEPTKIQSQIKLNVIGSALESNNNNSSASWSPLNLCFSLLSFLGIFMLI